nr:MAG TPA: Golgin subfamily A member 5 [Caudoviricetes sp.]
MCCHKLSSFRLCVSALSEDNLSDGTTTRRDFIKFKKYLLLVKLNFMYPRPMSRAIWLKYFLFEHFWVFR